MDPPPLYHHLYHELGRVGSIQWVSCSGSVSVEVRLYQSLFLAEVSEISDENGRIRE